jgi:hypothetical protein
MQQNPIRLLGMAFFGALALWVVVSIIAILTPSSGAAKASGIFGVIAFGAFFALLGAFLVERVDSLRGTSPAPMPAAAMPSPATPPPPAPRPGSFQG